MERQPQPSDELITQLALEGLRARVLEERISFEEALVIAEQIRTSQPQIPENVV